MTTLAVLLAALLAVAAVLWVSRPLLARDTRGREGGADAAGLERLRLLEERDRALAALKELEFDHRTGKISDSDYREVVQQLRRDAARTLAALDAATASGEAVRPPTELVAGPARADQAMPESGDAVPTSGTEREERPG
jgi:hypothetical protein